MKKLISEIIQKIETIPNDMTLGKTVRDLYLINKDNLEKLDEPVEDDRYIRLYAEFDNYKKRTLSEKEKLKNKITTDSIEPMLNLYDELTLSLKSITDSQTVMGINLMLSKVEKSLKTMGIEEIQTDVYDSDLHEVISVIGDNKNIIDVVSKGYTINGNIFKHPKIVLG